MASPTFFPNGITLNLHKLWIIGYWASIDETQVPYYPVLLFASQPSPPRTIVGGVYRQEGMVLRTNYIISETQLEGALQEGNATLLSKPLQPMENHLLYLTNLDEYDYFPYEESDAREAKWKQLWLEQALASIDLKQYSKAEIPLCKVMRCLIEQPDPIPYLLLRYVILARDGVSSDLLSQIITQKFTDCEQVMKTIATYPLLDGRDDLKAIALREYNKVLRI